MECVAACGLSADQARSVGGIDFCFSAGARAVRDPGFARGSEDSVARECAAAAVWSEPRLAVRSCVDDGIDFHAGADCLAVFAEGEGGVGVRKQSLAAISACLYLFLYLPLMVVLLASVNAARFGSEWKGFTLEWYRAA